ncbi:MAG: ribosome silencing factor [Elusimicrobiota bacterium]
MNTKTRAVRIGGLAEEKKAENIVILDVSRLSNFVSYLVICSVNSSTQLETVVDFISEGMEKEKITALHQDGRRSSIWRVLDYGDVLVHVFHREARDFYRLEKLWGEARQIQGKRKNDQRKSKTVN